MSEECFFYDLPPSPYGPADDSHFSSINFSKKEFRKYNSGKPANSLYDIYRLCRYLCFYLRSLTAPVAALTSGNIPGGLFHHLVGTALAQTDDQDISVGVTVLVNGDGTGCQRHILYSLHASHDIICLQIRSCCL